MKWWVYAIIIVGVLAFYLLSALIIRLLMNRAKKKAVIEYEKVIPYEKSRLDEINSAIKTMQDDGRFLPKNMIECLETINKSFDAIPIDVSSIKNQNDFMILYIRKYLKEKRIAEKYKSIDAKLESLLFLDPSSKKSPYSIYNKKASRYNAYLGMGFFNLFRGNSTSMPIL